MSSASGIPSPTVPGELRAHVDTIKKNEQENKESGVRTGARRGRVKEATKVTALKSKVPCAGHTLPDKNIQRKRKQGSPLMFNAFTYHGCDYR